MNLHLIYSQNDLHSQKRIVLPKHTSRSWVSDTNCIVLCILQVLRCTKLWHRLMVQKKSRELQSNRNSQELTGTRPRPNSVVLQWYNCSSVYSCTEWRIKKCTCKLLWLQKDHKSQCVLINFVVHKAFVLCHIWSVSHSLYYCVCTNSYLNFNIVNGMLLLQELKVSLCKKKKNAVKKLLYI